MSTQIDTAYVNQFSANIRMLAAQQSAKLLSAVEIEQVNGEFAYFDQLGSVEAVERVSRHADTPFTEIPHSRRRVNMRDWELSEIVDS